MRLIARFFGFLFATGAIVFVVGACVAAFFVWKYSQDLPDYTQLHELRAAGDDPRPCRRRLPARRICARAAALSADPGGAEAGDRRLPVGRGQELLQASRRRSGRHRPRRRSSTSAGRRSTCRAPRRSPSRSPRTSCSPTSRSFERKIKEALLALRIEAAYSKDKILELYLNEIYLGLGNYGVAAAALNYFGKSVHELTLAEAAYLAALPKAPNNYHPFRQREARARAPQLGHRPHGRERLRHARRRREGQEASRSASIRASLSPNTIAAGYFAEEVRREIAERYGEKKLYEGGLSVRTTLDPKMQAMARKALVDGLVRYDEAHGWRGAMRKHRADRPRLGPRRSPRCRRSATCSPGGSPSCSTSTADRRASACSPTRETSGEVAPRARDRLLSRPTASSGRAATCARRSAAGRRDLCRADGRQAGPVPPAPDPRDLGRDRRHGPLYRPRPRDGRRLLLRPDASSTAPRRRCASRARRSSRSSTRRRSTTATRRPAIVLDAPIEIDMGPGQEAWTPENYDGKSAGPAHAALRHRALEEPDDGAPRQGRRHAADRRIRQALRHLRRHAAGAVDVARRRRDDGAAHDHRLFDVRQRRQAHQADADRPHPGPLRPDDLPPRRAQSATAATPTKWAEPGRAEAHRQARAGARSADRLSDHLDAGRRGAARHRRRSSRRSASRSPARPAPPTRPRTCGSSASRPTSRSASSSATTSRARSATRRTGRPVRRADLPRLHEDGAEGQARRRRSACRPASS